MFRLQTEVTRLRASVERLGGPRDTVELRHKVQTQTLLQRHGTQSGLAFPAMACYLRNISWVMSANLATPLCSLL